LIKLNTTNFGEIEIDKEKIFSFPDGLLGFEEDREFVIINSEDPEIPFQWLQSLRNPDLAFVIINPFLVYPNYDIRISKAVRDKLKIEDEKDVAIYSIVVVPEDMEKMTANLLGPIILNIDKKLGKQVILDDDRYSTKHYIFQHQNNTEDGSG